LSYGGSEKHYT